MVFAWLAAATLFLAEGLGLAQTPAERKVQAAFLTKFPMFVEWPQGASSSTNDPIVIGILGADPFGADLDEIASQQRVKGRSIKVVRLDQVKDAQGCHILFVVTTQPQAMAEVIRQLGTQAVLTVGDSDAFLEAGGMVSFTKADGKVRFEVNHEAARRVGLALDARLLSISRPRK